MQEQTYAIASSRDFRAGTQEQPYTALTGHPYLEYQACALGIFNRIGSGRVVSIVDFFTRDLSKNNSTARSLFSLVPVSAWVLGTDKESQAGGYLSEFNSDNSNLPSQVDLWEDVESVTAGGTLRRISNLPFYLDTRALQYMCMFGYGAHSSPFNLANLFKSADDNNVRPITVREGEGLAVIPEGGLVQFTMKYQCGFWFRDTSNNQCYFGSLSITPEGGRVSALFTNASGSGKTYEVYNVEMAEVGTDNFLDQYSLEQIEYLNPNSGVLSDIYKHDSNNEDLTGKIDYRRDCSTTIAGMSQGAIIATPRMWRTNVLSQSAAPYLSGSMSLPIGAMNQNLFNVRNEKSIITLREGEGIGIFRRNMGSRGKAGIFIRFTVRNTKMGYAKSRVVNQNV